MRRCLVEKLACPECRWDIELTQVQEETAVRVMRGTLQCVACKKTYSIDKGVPRLVKVADDVAEVCKRFSFQWLSRWNGLFEGERCYGFNDDIYIGWVKSQLECRKVPEAGACRTSPAGFRPGWRTAPAARPPLPAVDSRRADRRPVGSAPAVARVRVVPVASADC